MIAIPPVRCLHLSQPSGVHRPNHLGELDEYVVVSALLAHAARRGVVQDSSQAVAQGEQIETRTHGGTVPGRFIEHVQTMQQYQAMGHVAPPSEGYTSVEMQGNSEEEIEPVDHGFEVFVEQLIALEIQVIGRIRCFI